MLRTLTYCTLGLSVCLLLSGCGPKGTDSADDHEAEGDAAHVHPTEGPHGGHLIELGNEDYHAELLHDEGTRTVTIYLLDGPAKAAVAGDEEEVIFQLFQDGDFVFYALKAVPASGDEIEQSHFALADETLCDTLIHADEVKGRLNVSIGGEQFTGMIEHHAHGQEGHDHGDHDGDEHDEDAHEHGADDGDGHEGHDGNGHDEDTHEHGDHDHE